MVYILCGVLGLLVVSIFLGPYRIRVDADTGGRMSCWIAAWACLYGFEWRRMGNVHYVRGILLSRPVGWRMKLGGRKEKTGPGAEESPKKPIRRRGEKKRRIGCLAGRLSCEAPGMCKRVLQRVDVEALCVDGRFGTGNPALTGTVYGFLEALQPFRDERFFIDLVPDFMERQFRAKVMVTFRVVLLELLWVGLCMAVEVGRLYRKCRS